MMASVASNVSWPSRKDEEMSSQSMLRQYLEKVKGIQEQHSSTALQHIIKSTRNTCTWFAVQMQKNILLITILQNEQLFEVAGMQRRAKKRNTEKWLTDHY